MVSKKMKYLYLLAILSSGLFYSYATTWLIAEKLATPFLIIFLSTVIDVFVFIDLIYLKKISKVHSRTLSLLTIGFLLLTLLFSNSNSLTLLIILYIFSTLSFSFHLLYFEQELMESKGNAKAGLINITLLRNFSKIIGFSLGTLIYNMQIQHYIVILVISFTLFSFINIRPVSSSEIGHHFKETKGNLYIFILAILGTTAVFWIPLFVAELKDKNFLPFSSIVFSLPGIVSIAYLNLSKKEKFPLAITSTNVIYILLLLVFLLLNILKIYFLLRVILFSFIVAVGISISIEVRAKYMNVNKDIQTKIALQTFNLIAALSLLLFALIAIYLPALPYYLIILNAVASSIILIYRKEFVI